ncbi:cation-dependent mannose-6-phosphate receptor [Varanus komodoensis]|uniref:Cation-dependent mannose-6-phosphate receptor n=1 Tax=Varanus komodoensis TaxID=61221 RepID=A0A8D2KRJ4_VARKO|nr:cation-dependent mannose-6-phosphate receptor [Varanus komodoensis]XP_044275258.1 cation-dependent mannose-6-phosphate receptor [Varanus komodoensis]
MLLAPFCLCAMLLAVVTTVLAEENTCDLIGDKGKESSKELALLKRLEPLTNQSFETESISEKEHYVYKFRVCREVYSDMSGLVQINKLSNKTTVVGRINETHLTNGSKWILLIYKGGDAYSSHCGTEKRKAIVMIICNRMTLASGFTMVTEEREKMKECSYIFELESSLACTPEDLEVGSSLSVGSILLIIFVSLLAVYITGGFLYQRLVVGAKGIEQFPHFAFWQDLGNLVADGCDFVCRSKQQNVPAAYRGVGDDQLGEESEERDDHLLPM